MAMKRISAILSCIFPLLIAGHKTAAQEQYNALIIPVEFQDLKLTTPAETLDSLAGQLSAYFNSQFFGTREFVFDVCGTVPLNYNYSYYGANATYKRDALVNRMAVGVYRAIYDKVDFERYDNSGDGFVRDIIFLTPGRAESSGGGEDQFWPQYVELDDKDIPGGLKIRLKAFAVASELDSTGAVTGIGVIAHEFGHVLGLKDLYDADGPSSGGLCPDLGHTSLMSLGLENDEGRTPPNLNAIEHEMLGTGICEVLDSSGVFSLESIEQKGRYLKLSTTTPDIYYLLENRSGLGRDSFIGGDGLLIYRINRSTLPAGYSTYYRRTLKALERWNYNQVNCNPEFPCAEIVAAVSDSSDFSKVFWPQHERTVFNPGPLALTDIRRTAGGDICFELKEPVHVDGVSVFQSSAIVAWTVSDGLGPVDSCMVEWKVQDSFTGKAEGVRNANGRYSLTIKGLVPRTTYNYTISVYFADGSQFSAGGSFTTRIYRSGIFRFIYTGDAPRNRNGSFRSGSSIPLVVFNSMDEEIVWTFNGMRVSPGSDGLWKIPGNGILKAEITNADGSKDIIIKELRIE